MKKILICISVTLLLTLAAAAKPIYKYIDKTPLSNAATLYSVREFYMDYNMSYSYIEVDLTDNNTKISLLKSQEGADVLSTVNGLAETNENVIGALNADFFSNEGSGKGFSLGTEIVDGHLLQSPIYPDTMATVAFSEDDVLMSYTDFSLTLLLPNGEGVKISHLNKHTAYYGDVLLYTHEWNGGMTKGVGGNVAEYIFEENRLVDIRRNSEPCEIPENGFALMVDEGMNGGLYSLVIGDEVEIKVDCSIDLNSIDTAFGGGSMLVYEGQDVGKIGDYAHTVAGFHPRSAIGVTEDKKTLYLLAVDGRQTLSRGMRMSHVAELLIELGCYYGVNLDGGGSTNMVASNMWSPELVSVNSPTENRRVINAIGIVLDADKNIGEPKGIEVKSQSGSVFIGDSLKVEAVVFDRYNRRADFEYDDIEWSSTSGVVKDGFFYPDMAGEVTVSAAYDELYADMSINVIDNVSGINTNKKIHMNVGDSEKIILSVFDYMGNNVDINDISKFTFVSSNENVATVKDGIVTAVGEGTAFVEVSKNDVKTYISVSVGSSRVEYFDSFEKNDRGYSLSPENTWGSFEISKDRANSGAFSGKFTYDFSLAEAEVRAQDDEIVSIDETETEDISRTVSYNLLQMVPIDGNCTEISIFVFAEKPFAHSLCALFTDDRGTQKKADFDGEITAGEWSQLKATVPSHLKAPVSLSGILLQYSQGHEKDKGVIYIDDLSFTSFKVNTPEIAPGDTYRTDSINTDVSSCFRVGTLSKTENPTPFSYHTDEAVRSYLRDAANSALLGEGSEMYVNQDKNASYIHINTQNGGIRLTNSDQWNKIASLCEDNDRKYLFITCDNSVFGKDEFENEVILDYFNSLDKEVFIIMSDSCSSYTDYGKLKLFTLDNSPAASILYDRNKAVNVIEFKFGDRVTFEFDKR